MPARVGDAQSQGLVDSSIHFLRRIAEGVRRGPADRGIGIAHVPFLRTLD
jgi:hypothetical protein